MDLQTHWPEIRRLFARPAFASIASVDAEGHPHVTPIGSLILHREPGKAFYFERFTTGLPRNVEREEHICAMAVDARPLFWLKALIRGGFLSAPAMRLVGRAGERRPATEREVELFQRRVKPVRWTKGYDLLWSPSHMDKGREITFDRAVPVRIGRMWPMRSSA